MSNAQPSPPIKRSKRGQISLMMIIAVIGVIGVAVVALAMKMSAGASSARGVADTFAARRGTFDITIPVSGELAALNQITIRNKVDGKATINEIVDEGATVAAGDVILKLNDDEIKDKLRSAQEKVNTANAAFVTAGAELTNTQNKRDAELAKADVAINLADLALKAWLEGEDPSKRQELALDLESAEKDYARLQERFAESAKLLEKKFLSLDEYKKDEIAMIEARSKLAQAKLDRIVYEKYKSEHDKAEKQSTLDQAKLDRKRIEDQYTAEVQSAQIEVDSKKFQLDSATEDKKRLEEQLSFCIVKAPSPGLVVYYSSLQQGGMGRNEGRPPVIGGDLMKNEAVMVLPDTTQMVASVKVSEALFGLIHAGEKATIISDANADRPLNGEVLSVGVLAEGGGWRDPNRRDYTVKILLKDGYDLRLKPSMRCKAEIYVGRVTDALHVPLQAVFRNGPINYVYVPQSGGYAQKQVAIGRASELFIEIKDGVSENQIVLLREPAPDEIVYRLPTAKREEKEAVAAADLPEAPPDAAAAGPGLKQPGGPPNAAMPGAFQGQGGDTPGGAAGAPGARGGNGGGPPGGRGGMNPDGTPRGPGAGGAGTGRGNRGGAGNRPPRGDGSGGTSGGGGGSGGGAAPAAPAPAEPSSPAKPGP